MQEITVLSQDTIDKIAAGEVVERPSSIVKELVENAVDAGANAVTVEIRDGGASLVRITDNGCGIPKDQVQTAYLRHATSKIRKVEDLMTAGTLGFRGEALSSIAAVSQVEMITKTAGSLTGVRYVIEGGQEKTLEEIGAPEGTTFLVRNLFYNTPVRKKFMKSSASEAGYVSDLMERLALSHPNISFKFINNRDTKLHTSGNGNLKDLIYSIYGREIAANLIRLDADFGTVRITGFIGKPVISRGNRNYENYFVNGRYVKNAIIARAIEDAYKAFMMNHRYPFTVLMIQIDTEQVDVNVHPQKLEVRFADQQDLYDKVCSAVKEGLLGKELIPEFTVGQTAPKTVQKKEGAKEGAMAAQRPASNRRSDLEPKQFGTDAPPYRESKPAAKQPGKSGYPEPFERIRSRLIAEANSPYEPKYPKRDRPIGIMKPVTGTLLSDGQLPEAKAAQVQKMTAGQLPEAKTTQAQKMTAGQLPEAMAAQTQEAAAGQLPEAMAAQEEVRTSVKGLNTANGAGMPQGRPDAVQMELFDHRLLSRENLPKHRLIGQLFDTYWLVEFDEKLYIIDQHAAHEKVMYERFIREYQEKRQTSQQITPSVIVTLNLQEAELLERHMDIFRSVGFEIAPFGGREYAISAVPGNLYGIANRELFLEILDGLSDVSERASDQIICEKIASMSCKAAVKGNQKISAAEADALIAELLALENPYNCPHGRPTIISMTKYDLEKKFRRVL